MLDMRAGPPTDESSDLNVAVTGAIDAVTPFAITRSSTIIQLSRIVAAAAIDADRLTQVFINVIDNAIKHGRSGGRVYVSVSPIDERFVEVRIDDDGPGVPIEEREMIFSLARRGANAQGKGSGIGLAVARLVIERNGGSLDVTESLLGGAQFRVRVPLVIGTTPTLASPASTNDVSSLDAVAHESASRGDDRASDASGTSGARRRRVRPKASGAAVLTA